MIIKIVELFSSIQGEGRYCGVPAFFIRLSGCTRNCFWCDSKYHTQGKEWEVEELVELILKEQPLFIVWTGGEPLAQFPAILEVLKNLERDSDGYIIDNHLETNGDLIGELIPFEMLSVFDYICCSPKDVKVAKMISAYVEYQHPELDIKVVTDLQKINSDLLEYATTLMPLTTPDSLRNGLIKRNVWDYCVAHNLKYSPRLHIDVWGNKKGV